MSAPDYYRNASGMQVSDISMHLPHPLASAFEYVARAGLKTPGWREDCRKALNWIGIEQWRRSMVQTQGHDAVMLAMPRMSAWVVGSSQFEALRAMAMRAIVKTACNWMLPHLLDEAGDLVTAMLEFRQVETTGFESQAVEVVNG